MRQLDRVRTSSHTSLYLPDALIVRNIFNKFFIVKRIPGVSQELIYIVSPSTIIHVNQLYRNNKT